MSDCPRFGRLIAGCRFEPRYDITHADSKLTGYRGSELAAVIAAMADRTYVGDVCIRCGKLIERPVEVINEPAQPIEEK